MAHRIRAGMVRPSQSCRVEPCKRIDESVAEVDSAGIECPGLPGSGQMARPNIRRAILNGEMRDLQYQ
jgi:hypothetical protein